MSDETKALARKVFRDVWSHADEAVADQIYARDYVAHIASAPKSIRGIEQFKQFVVLFRALSPDLDFTVEDQVAEGDKVVTRWTARGTTSGVLTDSAARGQQIAVTGISIHRILNGKLAESWDNWDSLTAMQALGSDMFESVSLSL